MSQDNSKMINFILLGFARTGSTLLALSMAGHPNVHMSEELFNDYEDERRRAFGTGCRSAQCDLSDSEVAREDRFYRTGEDGAKFLREEIFHKAYSEEIKALGFKIFYNQARQDQNAEKVWDYLIDDTDIRVVHLVRDNLLENWLSLQVAFETNEWARWTGTKAKKVVLPPFSLDAKDCESYFDEITNSLKWARMKFADHKVLEIEYEADLCAQFVSTLNRVHDFLGVPRRHLKVPLKKQAQRKPCEQISNYEELKRHFRHTPYEGFFE